jgi:1-acyl-sn-glycerol-3-phosphate acyltransferase
MPEVIGRVLKGLNKIKSKILSQVRQKIDTGLLPQSCCKQPGKPSCLPVVTAIEQAGSTAWSTPRGGFVAWPHRWRAAFNQPLPHLAHRPVTRFLCRLVVATLGKRIEKISGLEHLQNIKGPFVLCLNHNSRTEALIVPAVLLFHRGGRPVHFLADWNFMLYPGLSFLMRRAEVIPVGRKPARPRFLNRLKRFYVPERDSLDRAHEVLAAGGAVGIFPEGTVNRDPRHLLPGCLGAALLAQRSGAPLVPVGIQHPGHDGERPISGRDSMHLIIGAPLAGPRDQSLDALYQQHAALMTALSTLSGKSWQSTLNQRKLHVTS